MVYKILALPIHMGRKATSLFYTIIIKILCREHGEGLKVNGFSWFTAGVVTLGKHCNFNGMKIQAGRESRIKIGNYFHSGTDCLIIAQNHNYEGDKIPYDNTYVCKDVTIEDCVWIGSRVVILGGVTIKEGAIIQAGSVVSSDIPPCAIAGGNPARVFKYRDVEHYEKLKEEGRFH